MPNAHYIARSHGGLGIEENVVTLCGGCHHNYDNTVDRPIIKEQIKAYLECKYPNWDESKLIFRKWNEC
jgi:cytochrome c553